ncbi:hypothetical protein ACFFTM_02015 [Pseudoduganella plicata]|uniref:Uncharacterized protein n=1 Tax=Pseudoduganella plicata TaxID=321984 RepID=A0A4P7BDX9_9BURK|nr:hypothetical protein [Pseudoduganella plicata]QBQ36784.1 hypothetical protein E1742_11860 [Pseudoduganella plicata]GGY72762.1 hypothetical protein GCM10007388_00990 [Pseudoduganella plicata]
MKWTGANLQRLTAAVLAIGAAAAAVAGPATGQWVKDEQTLEPGATIYLSAAFGSKKGKFRAQPESMLDTTSSIDGSFIVGTYRYVYQTPERDAQGNAYDELQSTELLDCERNYYGTLRQVRKRNGAIVSETVKSDAQVSMMQMGGVNLGSKLCDLHAKRAVQPLRRAPVDNPAYKPNPSDQDIDALINRHIPAKK